MAFLARQMPDALTLIPKERGEIMRNMIIAKVGILILLVFTLSHAESTIDYYYKGQLIPITRDDGKFFLQFQGISMDEAINQLLNTYPDLSYDADMQPFIESFVLFGLDDSTIYDSISGCLSNESYIAFVNPVGVIADSLPIFVTSTIICRFNSSVSAFKIDSIVSANDLEIVRENEYMPGEYLLRLSHESEISVVDMAQELYLLPETRYVHPNFARPMSLDGYQVQDEYYQRQDNVRAVVSFDGTANGAWEITTGDTGIYIGIIDQGIEPHEDFRSEKFWYGFDFVDWEFPFDTFPRPKDSLEYHGISVLGLISAEHNNPLEGLLPDEPGAFSSIAGIAPKCRVTGARLFPQYSNSIYPVTDEVVGRAIGFTFRNGADIINCSWTWIGGYSENIEDAIDSAYTYGRDGLGTLIVFSSGNYMTFFENQILWPKTKENVLAIGAIDYNDSWFNYSCYGNSLDLVAPSGDLYIYGEPYSGNGVWTTDRMELLGDNPNGFDGCLPENDIDYRCTFGGTSAAAPLVTGTAALVLSKRPELTAAELMDVLKQSAVADLA